MSNRIKARPASRARRPTQPKRQTPKWLLPAVGVLVVIVVGVIGIALTGGDDQPAATVRINGAPLPALEAGQPDDAVGTKAPVFQASSVDGVFGTVGSGGGPNDPTRVFLFVSHWCDGCDDAVSDAVDLVAAGGVPEDVAVAVVLTDDDEGRANHPPDTWLRGLGWDGSAYRDSGLDTLADAYGVTQLPTWVVLDNQNYVISRQAPDARLETMVELATEG